MWCNTRMYHHSVTALNTSVTWMFKRYKKQFILSKKHKWSALFLPVLFWVFHFRQMIFLLHGFIFLVFAFFYHKSFRGTFRFHCFLSGGEKQIREENSNEKTKKKFSYKKQCKNYTQKNFRIYSKHVLPYFIEHTAVFLFFSINVFMLRFLKLRRLFF